MHAYRITLAKPHERVRETRVMATDAGNAALEAERKHPGFVAVLVVERYRVRPELHSLKAA